MDDWNDFGPPASQQRAPPPHFSNSESSPSSQASLTDSSAALLASSSSRSLHSSTYTPPPTDSTDDHTPLEDPSREREHSSFLSSIPFIGSSAARIRRDRHAAAAASATAAAAAFANGALATEATVVPVERSHMIDRRPDHEVDGISATSGSEDVEPISRMMPTTNPNPNRDPDHDPLPDGHPMQPVMARRGVLDDVPDHHEMNREGFRLEGVLNSRKVSLPTSANEEDPHSSIIASSLLKRARKSYTKLEVISAKQIKNLIYFFNFFVLAAIFWTVLTVILANTVYKRETDVPLPIAILHDDQRDGEPLLVPIAEPRTDDGPHGKPTTNRTNTIFPPAYTDYAAEYLKEQGWVFTADGVIKEDTPSSPANSSRSGELGPSMLETSGQLSPLFRQDLSDGDGKVIAVETQLVPTSFSLPPRWFRSISHFSSMFLTIFFFLLWITYGIRVFRQGRMHISHEQVWVFVLVGVASVYFNPISSILRIYEEFTPEPTSPFTGFVEQLDEWLIVARDIAFSAFSFFYVWVSLHSYRILDPTRRLGFREFYLVKLLVLSPYVLFRLLAHAVIRIQLSEVPLLSGPAALFIFADFNVWAYLRTEVAFAIMSSVAEALLVAIILYEAIKTTCALRKAPYMKYRTKRVGFRFFLYINFLFYPLYFALNCLLMFGIPRGDRVVLIAVGINFPRFDVLFFYTVGSSILIAGYVVTTAYVHLPTTSVGIIRGWFRSSQLAESSSRWTFGAGEAMVSAPHSSSNIGVSSSVKYGGNAEIAVANGTWANDEETPRSVVDNDDELEREIVEPITYRKRESHDSLELKANCFTMQTHVIMFNFAWYVYYYGTPKLDTFKSNATDHIPENPLPFDYTIAKQVRCEMTDTQALVVDCSDRIIITFKGTTSMRNLRTSLQMNHERLSMIIRTSVSGEDEAGRLKRLFGRRYINGKIHKGFAVAYRNVADEIMEEVRVLRERKQRPVFLTGHSLGGALATICSLDLWVKLDISRREIFVSTFGSPRVGNKDFASVYKEVVPLHWRIVVDPDMIAKLPNVGYTHVGKKVVLTPHGDMFIDPSALEARPWTGETAVFAYHRKASYMLAMRAWCVRHHGMTYTPAFWPFPIRQEDERRFPGVMEEEDIASERLRKGKVTSKIIHMDAMVDALGRGEMELANMAVVEKWARLSRRLLLQEKLISRA
eukprot:GFKZ01002194.1.p1 GENE.GFKZ01002194.1~~GFKZ01002194.1.p1  ORF type:complete len:1182 (+),score=161.31 GFKZ01002194.1:390-3935(+)